MTTRFSLIRLAIAAAAVLSVLGVVALVERLLTDSSLTLVKSEVTLPPGEVIPADQLTLEKSIAVLNAQITQHEGFSFQNEKPLQAAIAAIAVGHGDSFPASISDFVLSAFPAQGQELQTLLECFFYYKQAEAINQSDANKTPEFALAQLVNLQTSCFGDPVASRLFSQYRDMYRGMEHADESGPEETEILNLRVDSCDVSACRVLRETTNDL